MEKKLALDTDVDKYACHTVCFRPPGTHGPLLDKLLAVRVTHGAYVSRSLLILWPPPTAIPPQAASPLQALTHPVVLLRMPSPHSPMPSSVIPTGRGRVPGKYP